MSARPVFILCALTREARAIAGSIGAVREAGGGWRMGATRIGVIGFGGARLGDVGKPREDEVVIVAGLGGGLDPSLRSGEVVVDDEAGLIGQEPPGVRSGRIATSRVVVESVEAKRALRAETGAACVDMEQGVVVAWCGRPVVGVRAVFDDANMALPAAISAISDDVGGVRVPALAKLLLTDVRAVPTLVGLGRHSSAALRALAMTMKSVTRLAEESRASR